MGKEKGRKKDKGNVFEKEFTYIKEVNEFLKNEAVPTDEDSKYREKLVALSQRYEETLDESRLITRVSDRLQRRLDNANQKLEENNIELQQTVDALTKARVGRKATTIVLIIAVILFLLVEGVLEPIIDDFVEINLSKEYKTPISLVVKLILALFLRPIEVIVEKALMKDVANKKMSELKGTKIKK